MISVAWALINRDSKDNATVTCPDCGKNHVLDHEIDDAGIVTPSLECPSWGCDFHDMVVLEGWPNRRGSQR